MRVWRLARERHAATAFSGEGAARFGGRWNSRGVRMIYTSGSLSLAALETLVHLNPQLPLRYVAIPVEFEPDQLEVIPASALPADWASRPPGFSTQRLGDAWIARSDRVVLEVPSVIVPGERNYILNPRHREFSKLRIGSAEPFAFDSRLV